MSESTASLHVVILAAGQGKRMRSQLPKVLQPVGGQPMLAHVLATARQLKPAGLHVVFGHGGDQVRATFEGDSDISWVHQAQQLGTGHAVQVAEPNLPEHAQVLVLYGDGPLIQAQSLQSLLAASAGGIGVLTVELDDPSGYGRIIRRDEQTLESIIEEKDATPAQRQICEVNTGILAADADVLREYLGNLSTGNAQGEYYLTDVIAMAAQAGKPPRAVVAADPDEVLGANDRWQLAELERAFQLRWARQLCEEGATLLDPARLDVRGRVSVAADVVIDVNVVFEGEVSLGEGVRIGPHCVIKDCELAAGTNVLSHCSLEGVVTEGKTDIGPFARLRPGTRLGPETRVGNFVETKNTALGAGSKANHLAYVGDATVGTKVNIGAGTITCNYDGANKHKTIIEDGAFIGSDTQLVAPVRVGAGATIGAGTTVTRDAPADQLTISRARQKSIDGWVRPTKKP